MGLFLSLEVHGLSHILEGFKVLSAEDRAIPSPGLINVMITPLAVFFLYGFGLELCASPIFIHMIL